MMLTKSSILHLHFGAWALMFNSHWLRSTSGYWLSEAPYYSVELCWLQRHYNDPAHCKARMLVCSFKFQDCQINAAPRSGAHSQQGAANLVNFDIKFLKLCLQMVTETGWESIQPLHSHSARLSQRTEREQWESSGKLTPQKRKKLLSADAFADLTSTICVCVWWDLGNDICIDTQKLRMWWV